MGRTEIHDYNTAHSTPLDIHTGVSEKPMKATTACECSLLTVSSPSVVAGGRFEAPVFRLRSEYDHPQLLLYPWITDMDRSRIMRHGDDPIVSPRISVEDLYLRNNV